MKLSEFEISLLVESYDVNNCRNFYDAEKCKLSKCGWVIEYAHRFPACRMASRLQAWDYAGLLCNLFRDVGPKRYQHCQSSRAQYPLNHFYTWCNMLTGSYHSLVESIPLHFNQDCVEISRPYLR